MKNQFITDDNGQKVAVILPLKEYEKMLDDLDEYACIRAYDKVKSRKQEYVPASDVFESIEKKRKQ